VRDHIKEENTPYDFLLEIEKIYRSKKMILVYYTNIYYYTTILLGCTPPKDEILHFITENPAFTQKDIERRLCLTKQQVAPFIQSLENMGVIRKHSKIMTGRDGHPPYVYVVVGSDEKLVHDVRQRYGGDDLVLPLEYYENEGRIKEITRKLLSTEKEHYSRMDISALVRDHEEGFNELVFNEVVKNLQDAKKRVYL